MMNMNEEDVNLGIGSIRTRVINSSGAGVNAESTRRELNFAACDPLSELVWSSHNGLGFKCVDSRPADKKPFLLWNVGGSRDEAAVDACAELGRPGDCDDQDEASSAAATGAVNNNKTNPPISILYPPVEISETESRIRLYKEKGKENALSDEVEGPNGLGIKRRGYGKDVMHASKRIKNQIPLCSGSASIPRPDSSFMNWISNMVRGSTSFPMPLACSIDVNAKNFNKNFNGQDFASLNMGPQTVFQSLDMNILNTGEEKENESIEECRQLMVDDKKTLSKQIIVCDSTNTEASVDLKSTSKLCPIRRFGSSEAMTSVFARRVNALRHIIPSENIVKKDYQKLPLYDIVSAQNTVAMSEIFRAIRNLRLSRADILRWMNSDVSLSRLNGFFLRLRLKKKLDQGLEGATYYVACISAGDDDREVNGCTTNKSISVDVGGIKSSITSQYVSNHDFLEDEIKAWWCKAIDRGCSVPSIDELNSKFSYRTSLGL